MPVIHYALAAAKERRGATMRRHGNAVMTGFAALDSHLKGLQSSDLVVLAGRPSMGKTALAINILSHVTRPAQGPTGVAFFTLGTSPKAFINRMLASEAGVNLFEVRAGFFPRAHWSSLTKAAARVSEAPVHINDKEKVSPAVMLSQIKALSAELSKKGERLGLIIIDGIKATELDQNARQFKKLAVELNIPVVVLPQMPAPTQQKGPRPALEDLGDRTSEHADVVVLIHREGYYSKGKPADANMAELIVAKNPRGKTGTVALRFSKELASFSS